jgi:hypothetical protein
MSSKRLLPVFGLLSLSAVAVGQRHPRMPVVPSDETFRPDFHPSSALCCQTNHHHWETRIATAIVGSSPRFRDHNLYADLNEAASAADASACSNETSLQVQDSPHQGSLRLWNDRSCATITPS